MIMNSLAKALVIVVVILIIVTIATLYLRSYKTIPSSIPYQTGNYTSFNQISAEQTGNLQNSTDFSALYLVQSEYPSYMQPNSILSSYELVRYMRLGNYTSEEFQQNVPASPNTNGNTWTVMNFIELNNSIYLCSWLDNKLNNTNTSVACYANGAITPDIISLENWTYVTNMNGTMLGSFYQLEFSNTITRHGSSYSGLNTTYFHANVTYPANPSIHGNVTLYTSTKYGIPVAYTLRLDDPVYNADSNIILVNINLTNLSNNVTPSEMVPQYLASFLKNGTT